jgi:type IV secretory pathway TrbF-like protein
MTEEQYLANQNLQAQLRQYLSSFINNISVSNIDSILQQSAMLNELTSSTDSITRTMAVKIFFRLLK